MSDEKQAVTHGDPIDASTPDLEAMMERARKHTTRHDAVRVSMHDAMACQRAAFRAIADHQGSHEIRREILTAIKHLTVALERLS